MLLDHAVLPAETQAALLERAGGNPLYAEQVCRMLTDRGMLTRDHRTARLAPGAEVVFPESIQALITARLDALSPEQKTLLQDAAVVGKVFRPGALAVTGHRDAATIQDGLRYLARRECIRPVSYSSAKGETEYAFWHVLTRDVAYAQLPWAARMREHRAAASWIERTAGERVADHAEVLTHHYATALALARATRAMEEMIGLEELAARFLVFAGDRAMGLDAARADTYYQRALEHWPSGDPARAGEPIPELSAVAAVDRVDLLLRAAEAANQSGDLRRAVRLTREVVSAVDTDAEPMRAALAYERLGQYRLDTFAIDRASEETVETCRRAVELVPAKPATPLRARAIVGLADALLAAGRPDEARRWGEEALTVARMAHSGEDEARALILLALLERGHGDPDTARALLGDARARAATAGNRSLELRALQWLGDREFNAGNLPEACTALDNGTRLAE